MRFKKVDRIKQTGTGTYYYQSPSKRCGTNQSQGWTSLGILCCSWYSQISTCGVGEGARLVLAALL